MDTTNLLAAWSTYLTAHTDWSTPAATAFTVSSLTFVLTAVGAAVVGAADVLARYRRRGLAAAILAIAAIVAMVTMFVTLVIALGADTGERAALSDEIADYLASEHDLVALEPLDLVDNVAHVTALDADGHPREVTITFPIDAQPLRAGMDLPEQSPQVTITPAS